MVKKRALVTGSGGLVGSEVVRALVDEGYSVIGVDNDMRRRFFGDAGSTLRTTEDLIDRYDRFEWHDIDVRDQPRIDWLIGRRSKGLELVVHTAAQPSHDWAANQPFTDFDVNARGTLNLLEAVRQHAPEASFVFMSTNKVYGDTPNGLPLHQEGERLELPDKHRYFDGIDTSMEIDRSKHSLFGVSKTAADLLVQEYGRYFGMPTVCFRLGCITGPGHAGVEMHGFLAYLVRCAVQGIPYTVYGYDGLQVRDNISGRDVAGAVLAYHRSPRAGAVFNLGGGRHMSCSVREAISMVEEITGRRIQHQFDPHARAGDHRWWISDVRPWQMAYPHWKQVDDDLPKLIESMVEATYAQVRRGA